jgi:hypothetical protein
MLRQLTVANQEYIAKMEGLASKEQKGDSDLERAITYQISVARVWNRAVEDLLEAISEDAEE